MYRMETMKTVALVMLMLMLWTEAANADSEISLAIERDNLLPLVDLPESVVVRPRSDRNINLMATVTERRHDRLWQTIDVVALVTSTAALAWDWRQTRTWAEHNWQVPSAAGPWTSTEKNPILGRQPGSGAVDVYFATVAVLNAAIWFAMPDKYKSVIPAALLGIEASAIYGNIKAAGRENDASWTCRACGF